MPAFCRHGTAIESCPICRVSVEAERRAATQRATRRASPRSATSSLRPRTANATRGGRLTIRHEVREADDGFRSPLARGLRSSADAIRLADELARSAARLTALRDDPPGLYAEVASEGDIEEASWLAFLIAYIGPLEQGHDAFATIRERRTSWRSGELPQLDDAQLGPRSAHDPEREMTTMVAYRRWAERAGSQSIAYLAEASWSAAQRFERVFERLALPGLHRRARYDLLVTLGLLGRYPLEAASLLLSEDDSVLRAAKRVFGIGDRLTLERRVSELARACDLSVCTLDRALESWGGEGVTSLGEPDTLDGAVRERVIAVLGC